MKYDFDSQLAVVKLMVNDALSNADSFDFYEMRILKQIKAENDIRGWCIPYRKPPVSLEIWGPVIPVTWHLPKALAKWKKGVGKILLDRIVDAIKLTIATFLTDGGMYVVSYYHFPHKGTATDKYPSLHFHGVICVIRFLAADKVVKHGTSKLREWEKMALAEKKAGIQYFFDNPGISIPPKLAKQMNDFFRREMEGVLGKSVVAQSKNMLLWVGNKCLIDADAQKAMAKYMLNPVTNFLKKHKLRYLRDEKIVLYRKRASKADDTPVNLNNSIHMELVDFIKHHFLMPLSGFFGKRFYACGPYFGANGFNKLLKFAKEYPESVRIVDLHSSDQMLPSEMIWK